MNMTMIAAILAVVVALDHVLALIPSIKANNSFQLISNIINQALSIFTPKS